MLLADHDISCGECVKRTFTSHLALPHCTATTLSINKGERDWSDWFRAWVISQ